jgi:epoxyqueuosine reductase
MGSPDGSRETGDGRIPSPTISEAGDDIGTSAVPGRQNNLSNDLTRCLTDFFATQPRVLEWGAVSLASPPPHANDLASWVHQGLHAGLGYMEQRLDERKDPLAFVPWAKTVVLFSLRQPVPFGIDTGDFRVAAYARGKDYHRICHRIMDRLEEQLKLVSPDTKFLRFCDTSPVFERDLAAEAGLGWRGKNATLIHRKHGSGFLLAGFFLDVDLETPPNPVADFCGGCTACLDACPTDALVAPGKLDAGKCISYWTIEHKGEIPDEMSSKFGNWIYGCDICQDVCPWNHKHKEGRAALSPDVTPTDEQDEKLAQEDWPRSSEDWLKLLRKGGGFRSLLRHTPLPRAGRQALLRNVLIAMRNTGMEVSEEWKEIFKSEEELAVASDQWPENTETKNVSFP